MIEGDLIRCGHGDAIAQAIDDEFERIETGRIGTEDGVEIGNGDMADVHGERAEGGIGRIGEGEPSDGMMTLRGDDEMSEERTASD